MTFDEKMEVCAKALIRWNMDEMENKDMKVHDKEIEKFFTSQILLKKFEAFNIDVILPDMLLMILYICTEGNPGMVQILTKHLLNFIYAKAGGMKVQKGYVITAFDFGMCFADAFPIMEDPEISKKYEKMWDEQKYEKEGFSINRCDTVEWWKEVVE